MTVYVTKDDLDRVFSNYKTFEKWCKLLSKLVDLMGDYIHIKYQGVNDEHIH